MPQTNTCYRLTDQHNVSFRSPKFGWPQRTGRWNASMQQIADWLEKLGLGQYAQRFVENGIDVDVLPDLKDEDFDRLDVLLGHRRKMQRAIVELNQTGLI
ncbi:MAG TPA: SAM domain-containing protein, partial [Ktedonobacterales bacterium]|nr:SAM domain-containing protein [Ktedonobacterales bacterium]